MYLVEACGYWSAQQMWGNINQQYFKDVCFDSYNMMYYIIIASSVTV